jgi:hypothetical protein
MTFIALLQTAGSGGAAAFLINILPIATVILVLYFLFIARPKRAREHVEARQNDDRVEAERIWSNKSDGECSEAAKHLNEYTEESERAIRLELRRRSLLEPVPAPRQEETPEPSPDSPNLVQSERVARRYKDAYLVATTVVAIGKVVKAIGVIVALAGVIAAYSAGESFGVPVRVTFGAAGVLAGTIVYVFGVLIASQGQLQYAVLDVAVNSSPLLSARRKREIVLGSE